MSYSSSLARLRTLSKDGKLIAYLDANPDSEPGSMPYNMLTRELARLDRIAAQNAESATSQPSSATLEPIDPNEKKKIKVVDNPFVDISALPSELKEKFDGIKASAVRMHELHELLKQATDDAARSELAKALKTIEDTNADSWADIDEWSRNNGAEKVITPAQSADPIFMGMKREKDRRNIKIYIARYAKELADDPDPDRRKVLEDLLATRTAELAALETSPL